MINSLNDWARRHTTFLYAGAALLIIAAAGFAFRVDLSLSGLVVIGTLGAALALYAGAFHPAALILALAVFMPLEPILLNFTPGPPLFYFAAQFIGEITVYLALAGLAARRLLNGEGLRHTPVDTAIAAIATVTILSNALNQINPMVAFLGLKNLLRYSALFYLAVNAGLTSRQIRRIMLAILVVGATEIGLGAIQLAAGGALDTFLAPRPVGADIAGFDRVSIAAIGMREVGAIFGSLGDTVHYGHFLLVCLAVYLARLKKFRIVDGVVVAVVLAAIGFSFVRATLAAVVVALIVYYGIKHSARRALIAGGVIVGLVLLLLVGMLVFANRDVPDRTEQQDFVSDVLNVFSTQYIQIAMRQRLGSLTQTLPFAITTRPFIGYGLDKERVMAAQIASGTPYRQGLENPPFSNDVFWVANTAYTGLVGTTFWIFLFFQMARSAWFVMRGSYDRTLTELAMITLVYIGVAVFLLFFVQLLTFRVASFYFWLFPGLMLGLAASQEVQAEPEAARSGLYAQLNSLSTFSLSDQRVRRALTALGIFAIGCFLFKLLSAAILSIRLLALVTDVQQDVQTLQSAQDKTSALTEVRGDLANLGNTVLGLRSAIWPFGGVLRMLSWIPEIGPDIAAAPPMLDMMQSLLTSGQWLDLLYGPVIDQAVSGQTAMVDLPGLIATRTAEKRRFLVLARQSVRSAYAARQQIGDVSQLHPQLQTIIGEVDRGLEVLNTGVVMLNASPVLLGMNQPHHVLILLQNADEIRPSGGFITYSVYVVIDKGKITSVTPLDSASPDIDQVATMRHETPPEPLRNYMGIPIWLFRDSNWSPDFPTAATKAAQLYRAGRNVPVNTVVALNQYTIRDVLRDAGPITLSDGTLISDGNVIELFQDLWVEYSFERGETGRKEFIAELAPKLLESAANPDNPIRFVRFAATLQAAASRRDILMYSILSPVQAAFETLGWDGSIPTAPGDYLYVVDSNIGYNKADLNIIRSTSYHVSLANPANPFASLELEYANASPGTKARTCSDASVEITTYRERADDCYANYLRLYLPENTTLLQGQTVAPPAVYRFANIADETAKIQRLFTERGKEVYALLMVAPANSTVKPAFLYQLDPKVIFRLNKDGMLIYNLTVQRQPGVGSRKVSVAVDLPTGSTLIASEPNPVSGSASVLVYESDLTEASFQISLVIALTPVQQTGMAPLLLPAEVAPPATPTPRHVSTDVPPPTPPATLFQPTLPPTATVTPTPYVPIVVAVNDRAIYRRGPATFFRILGTFLPGTQVQVLGRDEINRWMYVENAITQESGWVAAWLLTGLPDASSIPVMDDIPFLTHVPMFVRVGGQRCQEFNWRSSTPFLTGAPNGSIAVFDPLETPLAQPRPSVQLDRTGLPAFISMELREEALPNRCDPTTQTCRQVGLSMCGAVIAAVPQGEYAYEVRVVFGQQNGPDFTPLDAIPLQVVFTISPALSP